MQLEGINKRNPELSPSGLEILKSHPYIGSSRQYLYSFCENACGEYEYPHSIKGYEITSYWNKTISLENIDGVILLKRTHTYYHQFIIQMTSTESKSSYFVAWTKEGKLLIEKIRLHSKYWENILNTQISYLLKHKCNLFWWELKKNTVAQSVRTHA